MLGGKKLQSSATLYTLIIFVAISIFGVALAVIFFIQAASYKSKAATLEAQTEDLATPAELRKIGTLVGDKAARQKPTRYNSGVH